MKTGLPGPRGDKGAEGPMGFPGEIGPPGDSGLSGIPGFKGKEDCEFWEKIICFIKLVCLLIVLHSVIKKKLNRHWHITLTYNIFKVNFKIKK